MNRQIFTSLFTILFLTAGVFAQTSWLDRPFDRNWNTGNGVVPTAPRPTGDSPSSARCKTSIRTPDSVIDRAVTRAGWTLVGPAQSYGNVTVVQAFASVDGMCRPLQHNAFVFTGTRYAGSLSPSVMDSRSDGSITRVFLLNATRIVAEFARYAANDPLCCPSQTSSVQYSITGGARGVVTADSVDTSKACETAAEPEAEPNAVTGTVTYLDRRALPPTAIITVRLLDVSRADAPSVTIAEQNIRAEGKQVPIPYELPFDPEKISQRNQYVVRAEINDGGRLLYTTDVANPVLTGGHPRSVDLTVVPIRGGGGPGQGTGTSARGAIRGTVTYQQRMALPATAQITVRLIDVVNGDRVLAQTSFAANNKQVPFEFVLPLDGVPINNRGSYGITADIELESKVLFKTEAMVPIQLRQNQEPAPLELVLASVSSTITGKTISLSKYGAGNMQIGGRSSIFPLIRSTVEVSPNGRAEVGLFRVDGGITFTGELVYFDESTLRIAVTNSGDADASGELEIKYNGRRYVSVTANNLVLDGQTVTVRF